MKTLKYADSGVNAEARKLISDGVEFDLLIEGKAADALNAIWRSSVRQPDVPVDRAITGLEVVALVAVVSLLILGGLCAYAIASGYEVEAETGGGADANPKKPKGRFWFKFRTKRA